jgi:hypothetical protein
MRCERVIDPVVTHPTIVHAVTGRAPSFVFVDWAIAWEAGFCAPACNEGHALAKILQQAAWWQKARDAQ